MQPQLEPQGVFMVVSRTSLMLLTVLLTATAIPACVTAPVKTTVLNGRVNDESGVPLPGATVCQAGLTTCVSTDSNGAYALSLIDAVNGVATLGVTKAGYAKQNRIVNATADITAILLRPVAQEVTITLPTTGGAPAVVTLSRDDASVTLLIPPDAIMNDATRQPVSGAIDVTATFWHPTQRMATAPADLLAENPNDAASPVHLTSLGMAQFELTQNGQKLQVVPGQHLSMSVVEPTAVRTAIASGVLGNNWPNLYSLDENTGLWHLEGAFNSEFLSYDSNSGAFNASLPHLSSWNVDVTGEPATPSCVQGTVTCTGGSVANDVNVTVWFMGYEQVKNLSVKTDANGHYCADVALSSFGSQVQQDVQYFVSGKNYTDTSMFNNGTENPYPASCYNCSPYSQVSLDGVDYQWCTDCSCSDCEDADTKAGGIYNVFASYYPSTGSAHATLYGNTSCAADNCFTLVNVAVSCDGGATDFCATPKARHLGEACTNSSECCASSSSADAAQLTCSDGLCVPSVDK